MLLAPLSAFLTRRMVDQIRGIDLDVVSEDRHLQGYTGVQDVYQIPLRCHALLKMVLLVSDDISRRNKS